MFVTSGLRFSGDSLSKESLGGSETALLFMAREFAHLGHEVVVLCNCTNPGVFDGVLYLDVKDMRKITFAKRVDILVVSRWCEYLSLPIHAGLRVLWLHDTIQDKNRVMGSLWQTDLVMTLSDYHTKNYLDACPDLEPLIWKTSNGVDLSLIEANLTPKDPNKLIYTSMPYRGLHYLLEGIFPLLLKDRPNLKLYVCTYDVSSLQIPPETQAVFNLCDNLMARYPKNIVQLGCLTKVELYKHISSSQLWVYPTAFDEISCISAMEAQACGTPVVTTKDFALTETVSTEAGVLIDGRPTDGEYAVGFAGAVSLLLADRELYDRMSHAGIDHIKKSGFTWTQIARSWEHKFHTMMEERWDSNPEQIRDALVRDSDLLFAAAVADIRNIEFGSTITKVAASIQERNDVLNPVETIPARLKEKRFLYQQILMQISNVIQPKSFLDACCGDIPIALAVAQFFPGCEVCALDVNKEVCERLFQLKEHMRLDIKVFHKDINYLFGAGKFDCIYMGDWLDTQVDFVTIINKCMKLLEDDGVFVFTSRYGPKSQKVLPFCEYDHLINFTEHDFNDMFGDGFTATFVEESGEGYDIRGRWIVCVRKKTKVVGIDLDRRKYCTRPYQSLVATLIVKDEEDNISRCLKRIIPVCDRVLVTDTGSSDKTVEIAMGLGAEILRVEFYNFAQARNHALSDIWEDWILWTDADEVLANAWNLRQYLNGRLFNGYSIRQNHLTLDLHGTYDSPIRLFRNKSHYKFVGYIHEHAEDLSKGPYDNAIAPSLMLPDVDIAHYGYEDEGVRRIKCSSRNIELLIDDLRVNPGRKLNKILAIRDYINIVKWRKGKRIFEVADGSVEQKLLSVAVALFLQHFVDEDIPSYYKMVFPMYQDALRILGHSMCPVLGEKSPPINIELMLRGSIGPLSQLELKSERLWFRNLHDYLEYFGRRGHDLAKGLGIPEAGSLEDSPAFVINPDSPEAIDLLKLGLNVY
jgi:glycosyltransferase involved in cell wall biosynthesis/ubiquinone/menaquinone biosynthesis C-methylase UbiE